MNGRDATSDLDRVLGDWLAEGPARTPEPVLATAVQHARSHPRRPDPLAFLRRDPMAPRGSFFGLPAVPVLAAIGLLLVALVGVSLVGGQREAPPPVLPATPAPTIAPSVAPTIGPSTGPSPTPQTTPLQVGLRTGTSATMTVDVVDLSGDLVDARTAPPVNGGSQAAGSVAVSNVDDQTLLLVWTDAACDIAYTLTLDSPTSMRLRTPTCNGDTIAVDRRLLLQFASPVDAADVLVTVVPVP